MIEILAPAGNSEMLSAAIKAGADAVYLGVRGMNMRASAKNFSISEIKKAVKYAHSNDVKVYVTLNTIIYEKEIAKIGKILDSLKKIRIDAVIAWDLSVLKMAKEKGIEIHLSTQASVSNSVALDAYRKYGVKRAVLARECTLEEIKKIISKSKIDIEVFCHGAMCVSESGRCFMSQFQYGKSANRGECLQACRRKYILRDEETGQELAIENNYVLSPKDLCTVHIIDKLIDAGVRALKIEGRARSPEYVSNVVRVYKEAVDLAVGKKLSLEKKKELTERLREVYNRNFSTGFFLGRPINDFWNEYGGKAKFRKELVGMVLNYYKKAKAFHGKLTSGKLNLGDSILIIGPTTGVVEHRIVSLRDDNDHSRKQVKKGELFTSSVSLIVRKNDKIYRKILVKK